MTLTKKHSISNLLTKAQQAMRDKKMQDKMALKAFNEANDSKILGKGLKNNLPPTNSTVYYVKFPEVKPPPP